MKAKLTVTISEELVPKAKRYAHGQGMSLSSLIERDLMRDLASEVSFSQRWCGKLSPVEKEGPRYRKLMKKHA